MGYQGLGLKVLNKYGEDKRWLGDNDQKSTWVVLYHGTSIEFGSKILESGLAGGRRNVFGDTECRFTHRIIPGG